jgi:hypothetical protein
VEDKCQTTMEAKTLWIFIFLFSISIKDYCWDFSGRMLEYSNCDAFAY